MKRFMCKFDESLKLDRFNAPNYIRGEEFDAVKLFRSFEIVGKQVSSEDQVEYVEQMLNDDSGWVAFICGMPEQTRLFAHTMMGHYSQSTTAIDWHHVTGSTWDALLDGKHQPKTMHMLVVDSLLTHPAMHPNASRAYDPKRIGKIFDIVAKYRGKASILILCPELTPEESYRISQIQPEFMLHMKGKLKEVEI